MNSFVKVMVLFLSGMVILINVILGEIGQYLFACLLLSFSTFGLFFFSLWAHNRKLGFFDVFSPNFLLPLIYAGFLTFNIVLLYLNIGWTERAQFTQRDLWYHLIGLYCLVNGMVVAINFKSIKNNYFFGDIINRWSPKRLLNNGTIILIIGLIGTSVFYFQVGVPWLGDVDQIRHGVRPRMYGLGFSIYLLQGLNIIFLSYMVYNIKRKTKYSVCLLPYIALITIISLIGGYRWPALIFLMSFFLMFHYIVKKLNIIQIWSLFRITLVPLIIFSLFGFFGYLRESTKAGGEERFLSKMEYINIPPKYKYFAAGIEAISTRFVDFAILTKMVPEEHDYFYGRYTLAGLPVINRIIPGLSREKTILYVSNKIFDREVSSAFTGCGVFFIDFGLSGVLIGFFLLGIFVEKIYLRMFRKWDLLSIAIFCYVLLVSGVFIVSGGLLGALSVVVMALVADKLIRMRIRIRPKNAEKLFRHMHLTQVD